VTPAPQPYGYKHQTVTACQTLAKASTADVAALQADCLQLLYQFLM
jgi:hypothetical protein